MNTCKAHLQEIEKCIKETLDNYLKTNKPSDETYKYFCIFKSSNNSSLSRDQIFKIGTDYFQSLNKLNKVDFINPDYVLFIQVICNICYVSLLENYFNYKKYNLIEMGCKYETNKNNENSEINEKK